ILPALSWLAPATVPHADANIPAPRTAKIVNTRLNSRSPSRTFIETSRNRLIETKTRSCLYIILASLFSIEIKCRCLRKIPIRGELRRLRQQLPTGLEGVRRARFPRALLRIQVSE